MPPEGKSFSQAIQTFISNSELGIKLAITLGRLVPPGIGYPLSRLFADFLASRKKWEMVRAARLNQWVVSGQVCSAKELDHAVRNALRFQARSLFELYRYLARPEAMQDRLFIPQELFDLIENSRSSIPGQGKVVVGIHTGNFDFALHTLLRNGIRVLAVTISKLGGGYEKQFDLRTKSGLEWIPASVSSFRLAIDRLKAGGVVLSGIDRPLGDPKHHPMFFGHPSPLPVHHILLAMKANVPVILLAVQMDRDGVYRIQVSDPIYMKFSIDRNMDIVHNAEAVLAVAEKFIRQAPEQWAMYYPVWPALFETVPG